MNKWNSVEDSLPEEGKYVLAHLTYDNWQCETDQEGVYFKVLKLVRGLSKDERAKMKRGELPESEKVLYSYPGEIKTERVVKRSSIYCWGDEQANNHRPYAWLEFGRLQPFGQDVDFWMDIPPIKH